MKRLDIDQYKYHASEDAFTQSKMPSTHTNLHVHIVFSTKDRYPFIKPEWRGRLHAYLGGIVKNLDAVPVAVGGVEDHVHILTGFKPIHRLDYAIRDIIKSGVRLAILQFSKLFVAHIAR